MKKCGRQDDSPDRAGIMTDSPSTGLDRAVFDALQALLFVVDGEIRVIEANRAARDVVAGPLPELRGRKGGDILRCVHGAGHAEGCGHAPVCGDCIIKESVRRTCADRRAARSAGTIEVLSGQGTGRLHLLVTTGPIVLNGTGYVLLSLEDITEFNTFNGILPICSFCKKIRDDRGRWERMESYLESRSEARFSHSVCPDCMNKHYPGLHNND